jgi:ABC-type tungstate transport system substrate-binding protein
MATLLRTGTGQQKADSAPAPSQPSKTEATKPKLLIQVSLVLADALLLGLAVFLVMTASGPLGVLAVSLCVAAFLLGAWLTSLALWL